MRCAVLVTVVALISTWEVASARTNTEAGADIVGPFLIWAIEAVISGIWGVAEGRRQLPASRMLIRWLLVTATVVPVTPFVYALDEGSYDFFVGDALFSLPIQVVVITGTALMGWVTGKFGFPQDLRS